MEKGLIINDVCLYRHTPVTITIGSAAVTAVVAVIVTVRATTGRFPAVVRINTTAHINLAEGAGDNRE